MSGPLIGMRRETGCAGGDARERPVFPARSAGLPRAVLGTGDVADRPRPGSVPVVLPGRRQSLPLTGRRAAWPRARWPGRLALAVARRAARAVCRRPGCAAAASRSSSPGGVPGDLAGRAAGISRRPGTPARCLAARAWRRPASAAGARTVSRLMPATGSGRDAIHGPAPDDRPAPPPGPPGVGMIPAQPSPAPSPPRPGSGGAAPGIPGAAGMAWRDWRWRAASASCGQPLVPTGPQDPVRIFSNHTVLAGAPLRNRTVDLLLTMHADSVCRRRIRACYCRTGEYWCLRGSRGLV